MKITKRQLQRIIKESMKDFGQKFDQAYKKPDGSYSGHPDEFEGSMLDLDDYEALKDMVLSAVGSWSSMTGYAKEDAIHALKSIVEEI